MFFRSLRKAGLLLLAGLAFAGPASSAPAQAGAAPRLQIPRLQLDLRLGSSLDLGPQLYYQDEDTVAIAGHRTTHTHPFLRLPSLKPGDEIRLGQSRYLVKRSRIVRPSELWVLRYKGLVLSACHPAGSSKYRYIVFATKAP